MKKLISLIVIASMILTLVPVIGYAAEPSVLPIENGDFEADAVSSSATAFGNTVTGWTQEIYTGGNSGEETYEIEDNANLYTPVVNVIEKAIVASASNMAAFDGKALQLKASQPGSGVYAKKKISNYMLSDPVEIPESVQGIEKNYTLSFDYGTLIANTRPRGGLVFLKLDEETGDPLIYNNGWVKEEDVVGPSRYQTYDAAGNHASVELVPGKDGAAALGKWGTATVTAKAPADAQFVQVAIGLHVGASQRVFYDNVKVTYYEDSQAPASVSNLSAEALNAKTIITWNNPADEDLVKNIVYVHSNGEPVEGSPFTVPAPEDTLTISGLTNGVQYSISVVSFDEAGNFSEAAETTVVPCAPDENTAPSVVNPIADKEIWADDTLSVDVSNVFVDANGDDITITTSLGTISNGVLTYDPAGAASVNTVTLTAFDGQDYGEYSFTLTVKAVPNETPANVGDKYYLPIKNPGFERVEVPESGQTAPLTSIIGWKIEGNPQTADISSAESTGNRLYGVVRSNIADSNGNALFLYDQNNNQGIMAASDLIPLPAQSLVKDVKYDLEYTYKVGFKNFEGTVAGAQFGIAVNYYNADGKIWAGSGWSSTITKDSSLADQFSNGKVKAGGAGTGTYCHKWTTTVTNSVWVPVTNEYRTAPAGAAYARFFMTGSGKQAWIFAMDNIKMSYTKEYVNVNTTVLTEGLGCEDGGSVAADEKIGYGDDLIFTVTPNEGYVIDYVKVNDVVVASGITSEEVIKLSGVSADQNIIVNFVPGSQNINAATHPIVYNTIDAKAGASSIVFGTAKATCGDYALDEYGIVYSKTESNPEIGKSGCVKRAGIVAPNMYGQYGIQLMGRGLTPGSTYYAKAYAVYKNGETSTTVYGDAVSFTVLSE